ncbi:hypothetical protein L2D04_22690 (plasmid) [Pantoea agglomerans]|nr:hypothetical protein [Pantoea agglomerans]UJQ26192.1 hypothetical protein L2D04_22690 [Pantoea agglomerans]
MPFSSEIQPMPPLCHGVFTAGLCVLTVAGLAAAVGLRQRSHRTVGEHKGYCC